MAALLAAVSPSCGSRQHAGVPPPGGMLPPGAGWVQGPRVAGDWAWSHISDQDGVRRIELETWKLTMDGDRVAGSYQRKVAFLSLDGMPFQCNQDLSYQVEATYQISGSAHARWVDLAEDHVATEPSPCDDGFRRLTHYQAFVDEDGLLLIWKGGSQVLHRASPPPPAAAPIAPPTAVAGGWVWRNRTDSGARGEATVEREEWELAEDGGGRITGTYLRDVTVFHPDGAIYGCSGAGYYRFRDRFTLVGVRDGDQIRLTETAVDPEPNPCLGTARRHLDGAVGRLDGGHLELTWRGGHRQILHRPEDHPGVRLPGTAVAAAQR